MAKRGQPPPRQQPTLGQATGGRPGRVPPARPAPAPKAAAAPKAATPRPPPGRPPASGLGIGLGLNPAQQRRFQAAAQQGQGAQFLGTHPGLAKRVQNRVGVGTPQETRLQNFIATGQSQLPPRPTPQPLGGAPIGPAPAAPAPPPAAAGPTLGDVGGNAYNPWTGGNYPLGGDMGGMGDFGVNAGMQSVLASRLGGMGGYPQPQPSRQYRMPYGGGEFGGGQMPQPQPPSGYSYDATGNLRAGWRPPSAGGIGGNPMMTTATIYPAERGGGWGGAGGGLGATNPMQDQLSSQMGGPPRRQPSTAGQGPTAGGAY